MAGRTTAKTELFSQWMGGQLTIADQGQSTGGRLWVHSVTGAATTGYGLGPDKPITTLNGAIALATASKYDTIYLMPGHVETISTAALSPDLSKIGLKVIGLGEGALRPTFTFTHVDANIIFSAASCSLRNVVLVAGVDNVVELVDLNATDGIVENCEFRDAAGFQATTAVDITGAGANAADRCVVRGCKFYSEAAGAVNAIQISQVEDALVIENNLITGDYSDAAISSNQICTSMLVKGNIIRNVNAADWAIELTAAATGWCVDNRLMSDAVATALDPGSLMCAGNLWTGAIDVAAVPIPAAAAGVAPAGSIDAAAIANDAIDATAIANGAIDAATFAAGAIDAAAIANDAIDATAIANGAIDAATFAAGAIDAAAVAADAIDASALALSAGEKTCDGVVVTRTTGALPQTAGLSLFTVTGHVVLKRIVGVVTTQLGGVGNITHLRLNSTGAGATTDLCLAAGGLEVNGDVADTTYTIDGTVGNAMVATTNLPFLTTVYNLLLVPGALEVACAGSDGGGGRVRWSATYVPLEAGAQMVATAP